MSIFLLRAISQQRESGGGVERKGGNTDDLTPLTASVGRSAMSHLPETHHLIVMHSNLCSFVTPERITPDPSSAGMLTSFFLAIGHCVVIPLDTCFQILLTSPMPIRKPIRVRESQWSIIIRGSDNVPTYCWRKEGIQIFDYTKVTHVSFQINLARLQDTTRMIIQSRETRRGTNGNETLSHDLEQTETNNVALPGKVCLSC